MIAKFQYQPPSFLAMEDARVKHETDKALKTLATAHGKLVQTAIQSPAQGGAFQVVGGIQAVTGSKLSVKTGLSKVVSVTVSIDNGAAPSNLTASARITPSDTTRIDLFVSQPTAAGNTAPIAATSAVNVHWWAVGDALVSTG